MPWMLAFAFNLFTTLEVPLSYDPSECQERRDLGGEVPKLERERNSQHSPLFCALAITLVSRQESGSADTPAFVSTSIGGTYLIAYSIPSIDAA